jgi:hypothetical protein
VLLVHADRVRSSGWLADAVPDNNPLWRPIGVPVEDDFNIRILVHEQIREEDIETLRVLPQIGRLDVEA